MSQERSRQPESESQEQAPVAEAPEPLSSFTEGQWWIAELDRAAADGADDLKRAVAVVHHMLRSSARKSADEGQAVASRAEEVAPVAWRWFAYGCWQVTHDQELAKEIATMGNPVESLYAAAQSASEAKRQECSHCNGRRLLPWRDGSWTMPCPWCKHDRSVEKAAEEARVLVGTVTGSFPSWVHAKIIAAIDRLAALASQTKGGSHE